MSTLADQGFRFIYRPKAVIRFNWRHPAEIQPGDTDCTDMTDEEFEAFVESIAEGKRGESDG